MEMRQSCTTLACDVLCIIGNYLNNCVNASAMVSLTDSGGRILVSFKYLRNEISYGRYVILPLAPSLVTLLINRDIKREVVARRVQDPAK